MNLDLARNARSLVDMRSERLRTEISRLMEAVRVTGHFGVTNRQVEQWIASKRFFFILAIGRSGTTFLADVLNMSTNAAVFHEPTRSDIDAYRRAFFSPADAERYIASFRKKEMYLRTRMKDFTVYGEVNSLLRRHSHALKRHFPGAGFIHLVRDGRDVVRTMMSTNALKPGYMYDWWLRPHESDPFFDQWSTMDRFAKLCWYWRVENQHLRTSIGNTVRFEDVIADYECFEQRILRPFGLDLPQSVWKQQVGVQRNPTKTYKMPHWREWDARRTQTFETICGDEMRANGYLQ
ncbi:MAG TPA: sulfotransferase [Gemmatimonadales bacterium]|nr:sulfotransferase [Gemmatimonadales bacterium]